MTDPFPVDNQAKNYDAAARPLSAEVAATTCRCPANLCKCSHKPLTQVSEKPDREDKPGAPFRKAKQRARLLLSDFNEAEMRETLERVIDVNPEVVCGILCDIWEAQIELAKSQKHMEEAPPACRCRVHKTESRSLHSPSGQGTLF